MKKILLFLFAFFLNVYFVNAATPKLFYFNQHAKGFTNSGSSRIGSTSITSAKYDIYLDGKYQKSISMTTNYGPATKVNFGEYVIKQTSLSTGYVDELIEIKLNLNEDCYECHIDIEKTPVTHEISFNFNDGKNHNITVYDSSNNVIFQKTNYENDLVFNLNYDNYSIFIDSILYYLDTRDLTNIYDANIFNISNFTTKLKLNSVTSKPVVSITCQDHNGVIYNPYNTDSKGDNNEENTNVLDETNLPSIKEETKNEAVKDETLLDQTTTTNKTNIINKTEIGSNESNNKNEAVWVLESVNNSELESKNLTEEIIDNKNLIKKEEKIHVKTNITPTKRPLLSLLDNSSADSNVQSEITLKSPKNIQVEDIKLRENNKNIPILISLISVFSCSLIMVILLVIYRKFSKKMQKC